MCRLQEKPELWSLLLFPAIGLAIPTRVVSCLENSTIVPPVVVVMVAVVAAVAVAPATGTALKASTTRQQRLTL